MGVATNGEEQGAPGALTEERVWALVPRCTGFPAFSVLCTLLPLVAACMVFSPSLPVFGLAIGTGIIGVFSAFLLWGERFDTRRREVVICLPGVRVGKRQALWESITEVRKVPAGPMVIVCGKRRLSVPTLPVVLREVIPEILRRLPGVKVSRRAQWAIEHPDLACQGRPWTVLVAAAVLVLVPIIARHAPFPLFFAFVPFVLATLLTTALLSPPLSPAEPERPERAGLLFYAGILYLVYPLAIVADVPLGSIDALAAMVSVLYLFAAACGVFEWRPKALAKGAVLCLALAIPLAVYYTEKAFNLRRTEVTHLLVGPNPETGRIKWSPDGRWLASVPFGGRPQLIDTVALRSRPLPVREHSVLVYGVGNEFAVRMVRPKETRDLVLSRFSDGQEVDLSVGMWTSVMPARCISPGGGLVCWLARPDSNEHEPSSLMVHDVRAQGTRRVDVAWPDGNDIDWQACWWIDDRTLAVRGQSPWRDLSDANRLASLHLLRVEYPSGAAEQLTHSQQFQEWTISPDARHAFVLGSAEGYDRHDLWYLDIASGQKTPLTGSSIPRWQQDRLVAWRVTDSNRSGDGEWLCRFHVDGLREERVLRIRPDERLDSVSPRGQFAILHDAVLRLRPLRLIQVGTENEKRLDDASILAAIGLMGDWRSGSTGGPWMGAPSSIWSPDETRFALPSLFVRGDLGNLKPRLFIYDVPPDWLK